MSAGSQLLTNKAAIKRLAQDKGPFAIAKLVALMECGKEAVELSAAQALLDRGFGRPEQTVDANIDAKGGLLELLSGHGKAKDT